MYDIANIGRGPNRGWGMDEDTLITNVLKSYYLVFCNFIIWE
jgi:hypothetical protein